MKNIAAPEMELIAASSRESIYRKVGEQETLVKFSESNENTDQPAVSVLQETESNPLPVASQQSDSTKLEIEPSSGLIELPFPEELYPVIRSQKKFTKQRTSDVNCTYRSEYQHKYHGVSITTVKSANQLSEKNLRDAIEAVLLHHQMELGFAPTRYTGEIVEMAQKNGYEEFTVGAYDWDEYEPDAFHETRHKVGIASGSNATPNQLEELDNREFHLVI